MFRKIYLLCFFIAAISISPSAQAKPTKPGADDYLNNRISRLDKRYATFFQVLELMKKTKAKTLVETGTARCGDKNFWGDGGSTVIFGDWAAHNKAVLYTVDINPEAIENAKSATKPYARNIEFIVSDSIKFLKDFPKPIDFLYLDSYDFDYNNPQPSQEHHLHEIIAAYPLLHKNSIVMIDDCELPFGGKGKLIIEYLTARNWVILTKGYQTILVPQEFDKAGGR